MWPVSLLLGSVLFLLMPLSMYDSNPSEFPMVAYSEVLFYSAVMTMAVAGCVYSVLRIARRFSHRMFISAMALAFGLSLAFYVQGNLIGVDYGVLDGREIQWDSMRTTAVVNSLIWAACVLIPVIVAVRRPKLISRCLQVGASVFLSYVMLLCIMLVFMNISAFERKKPVEFTMDKLMELSSERNLIVIILDSFDRAVFDRLLENDPEWRRRLAGFTYYHNTVSAYCYTSLALPQIVSGYARPEEGLTVWHAQRKAYKEAPFLKHASQMGFKVDAYYDETVCPLPYEFDGFDLFGNVDANEAEFISGENARHYASLYFFSLFRYLPHTLKRTWCQYSGLFKERFYMNMSSEKVELELCRRIQAEPFSLVPEKKIKFYHCSSLHVPTFSLQKAKESLEMVCRFINKTRVAGVFDKTDFFVMADHGSINRCRPLFMCTNGTSEFKTSEMPFSYRHLYEAFVDALSGRPINPVAAKPSEMAPIIDDPRRGEMTPVDEKVLDNIGSSFFGIGLELLSTTAGLNVEMFSDCAKMTWNGEESIIGVPIGNLLQRGVVMLSVTFDRRHVSPAELGLSVQYSGQEPTRVDFESVLRPESTEVVVTLPDAKDILDKRLVRLILHKWKGSAPPSIIDLKVNCNSL